jgi:Fe-S-cluster containining protein
MEQESPPGYLAMMVFGVDYKASFDDWERLKTLPTNLLQELVDYRAHLIEHKTHPNKGICIWFDETTKRCKHYELRPDVCREVVKCGDASCIGWRKDYNINGEGAAS